MIDFHRCARRGGGTTRQSAAPRPVQQRRRFKTASEFDFVSRVAASRSRIGPRRQRVGRCRVQSGGLHRWVRRE